MEELEKLETNKTTRIEGANRFLNEGLSITIYKSIGTEDRYYPNLQKADKWLLPFDFVLSPGLLADLKIFKNIGTLRDIQSGS